MEIAWYKHACECYRQPNTLQTVASYRGRDSGLLKPGDLTLLGCCMEVGGGGTYVLTEVYFLKHSNQ